MALLKPKRKLSQMQTNLSILRYYLGGCLYKWKKLVKERDNYTCQRCGNKNNLEVHHLIPLRTLIRDFLKRHPDLDLKNEENLYFATESLKIQHTINIGITVCLDCHCDIDSVRNSISKRLKDKNSK